jgi:hypothetical protein
MRQTRITTFLLLGLAIAVLSGCASLVDLGSVDRYYNTMNWHLAQRSLEERSASLLKAQGPIILNYDLGLLSRLTGDWRVSNERFSESERLIQEAYTQSITANLASFIINDNTKAYGGEEYEDLYLNIFKALNYLALHDEERALVELNRSLEKQAQLKLKYERDMARVASYARQNNLPWDGESTYATAFSTSALANYLLSIVSHNLGEENLAYFSANQVQHAYTTQPTLYPFPIPTAAKPAALSSGKGRLHLLAFTGRAPSKEERWEYLYWDRNVRLRIAYPVLSGGGSIVHAIRARVLQGGTLHLEQIESIGAIAEDTFKPKIELAYQKSVMRSLARLFGISVSDSLSSSKNDNLSLLGDLMGIFFKVSGEVAERADVRSTHYLPSEAWVGSIDLNPGIYDVELSYLGRSGQVLATVTLADIAVTEGLFTLAEATFPR